MTRLLTILVLFILGTSLHAQQTGGYHVFNLLNTSSSARSTGLGGQHISIKDQDLYFAFDNPAVANPLQHNRISVQHEFWAGRVNHGTAMYARHLKDEHWNLFFGIRYIDYGDFSHRDDIGNDLGTFDASEQAYTLGASRVLSDRWNLGLSLSYMHTRLESYKASGLAANIGFHYQDTTRSLSLGIVAKNIGGQLKRFYPEDPKASLPFDLQFAFSKRMKHLPFRFTILAHHLHQWDIRYDDPNTQQTINLQGESNAQTSNFAKNTDRFFRHLTFNGEFLIGTRDQFKIRLGYNHLRRRELKETDYRSLSGFSGGLGYQFRRFQLDYGFGAGHLGAGNNHIGVVINL